MRLPKLALLGFLVSLSACGSSDSTPSLTVKCGGSLALAGALSIDVASDPATRATTLSFPDPVNAGHTGSIPVNAGQRCTITPALGTGK